MGLIFLAVVLGKEGGCMPWVSCNHLFSCSRVISGFKGKSFLIGDTTCNTEGKEGK